MAPMSTLRPVLVQSRDVHSMRRFVESLSGSHHVQKPTRRPLSSPVRSSQLNGIFVLDSSPKSDHPSAMQVARSMPEWSLKAESITTCVT